MVCALRHEHIPAAPPGSCGSCAVWGRFLLQEQFIPPCAVWSLIPSHKMDHWEWAAVFVNGPLGCKSYTCAGGTGGGNDMKQNKIGDFQEMMVANVMVHCHFFISKCPPMLSNNSVISIYIEILLLCVV